MTTGKERANGTGKEKHEMQRRLEVERVEEDKGAKVLIEEWKITEDQRPPWQTSGLLSLPPVSNAFSLTKQWDEWGEDAPYSFCYSALVHLLQFPQRKTSQAFVTPVHNWAKKSTAENTNKTSGFWVRCNIYLFTYPTSNIKCPFKTFLWSRQEEESIKDTCKWNGMRWNLITSKLKDLKKIKCMPLNVLIINNCLQAVIRFKHEVLEGRFCTSQHFLTIRTNHQTSTLFLH